jgi:hypothetical protein
MNNIMNAWSLNCGILYGHTVIYVFYVTIFVSDSTTVPTVRKFEVMDGKCNIIGVVAGGKYGEKFIQVSAFIDISLRVLLYRRPPTYEHNMFFEMCF